MPNQEPTNLDIRILVVDDYAMTRSMVQSILKSAGFRNITQADDGATAVRRLREQKFDLVICDWRMPKMSGVDFLKYVRSLDSHKHVPFLMLTAEVTHSAVKEAVEAGVTDYIAKPFTADVLLQKVFKLMAVISENRSD
ncbi:MAG: response regulator [Deltaproteobacteria bacterium]|nr:response regulator [Deltaproteobacteria bacterium]